MKKTLLFVLLLSALLIFAGCSKGDSDTAAAADTADTAASAPVIETAGTSTSAGNVKSAEVDENTDYKDTVTIGIANDVNNLDPQGSNTDANMMVFYLTHERLVNIDPDTNEVIPALAESWTVSAPSVLVWSVTSSVYLSPMLMEVPKPSTSVTKPVTASLESKRISPS